MTTVTTFNNAAIARINPHQRQRLFVAAKRGDAETLRVILAERPDAVAWRLGGRFVLQAAANHAQMESVRILLEAGANPNLKIPDDYSTPLLEAVRNDDVPMMKLLMEKNAVLDIGAGSVAALPTAIRQDAVNAMAFIIEKGASISAPDESGQPPLHAAISAKRFKAAQLLLDKGADINIRDAETLTPLMLAAKEKNLAGGVFLTDRQANEKLRSDIHETADDMAVSFAGDDNEFLKGWLGMAEARRRRELKAFLPAMRNGLGEDISAPPRAVFKRKI